jgi:hypothetical protein
VDVREGGEVLGLLPSRPRLELTAAASNGAAGGSTAARPGQEGGGSLYGRPGSSSATTRPSAASMGACAGLGRREWQGGLERTDGRPGVPDRTARGARSRGGGLRDRLGTRVASGNEPREGTRGLGCRGGRVPARVARLRGRHGSTSRPGTVNLSLCPCLN